jgi:hypothetical protein
VISSSILIVGHVFLSNIFLLNFLVAILSTVYEIMEDQGEFEYKKAKYEFIEKYSIALDEPDGYYELVIHPPPLNIFTLVLLPFMIKSSIMKQASEIYAKFIFWFENSFYIFGFLIYELILCPVIFVRVLYNIFRLSRILTLLPLILFWFIIGPLYLLFSIFRDVFYFIKILCDYHEEEDNLKEKEEEDFK